MRQQSPATEQENCFTPFKIKTTSSPFINFPFVRKQKKETYSIEEFVN